MTTGLGASSIRCSRSCISGAPESLPHASLFESFDVGAGDERPARADDDDRLNAGRLETRDRVTPEAVDHLGTERVDGWVVDANERDALVDAECDGLIHMRRPASMAGTPIISP